jgi:ElaB/YqjD/DUF883 family membrane-anchored ribosome-binding protein
MNILLKLLPLLFRKKKNWILIALIAGGAGYKYKDKLSLTDFAQFGKEPRDVLVDRVEDARDAQKEAAEEFKTALEKFKDVTNFDGGDLETKYNTLNAAYESSKSEGDKIFKKIKAIESAANTLLTEWDEELGQYENQDLKRKAEAQLHETKDRCNALIASMLAAHKKMDPILDLFKDQVLFLKHNLNAQAISSLEDEAVKIESDVDSLIAEMEASIQEADDFIKVLLGAES